MRYLCGNQPRLWTLIAILGLSLVLTASSGLQAQDAEGTPPAEGTPAADSAAPTSEESTTAAPKEESFLLWLIKTSGLIGGFLLLLSFYFVATCFKNFLDLRPEVIMPSALVEETENLLKARDIQGIYKAVKQDESFFATVMGAGMTELQQGLPEARETMERVADAQVVEMERKISMLAVIGTLGPMIGLLGTLKGMIASFSVIAMSGQGLDAGEVAEGISEALVLTFEGVFLSVPAIYFFAVFRNRIAGTTTEAMLFADDLLRRINAVMRGKAPPPSAVAPAAPAAT
jgi:biopolymer transport protein ExbB